MRVVIAQYFYFIFEKYVKGWEKRSRGNVVATIPLIWLKQWKMVWNAKWFQQYIHTFWSFHRVLRTILIADFCQFVFVFSMGLIFFRKSFQTASTQYIFITTIKCNSFCFELFCAIRNPYRFPMNFTVSTSLRFWLMQLLVCFSFNRNDRKSNNTFVYRHDRSLNVL